MAFERIDIEVTDKVDPNVAKKMNQIADGADRADKNLKRLKTALAAVNSSALDRLASAMAKADTAQAKLINAQARLTSSQNAGAAAAQKAALAQQKLATESARTEAAQARAAAATTNAESAALRLQAAQGRAAAATAQASGAARGNGAANAATATAAASAASSVNQLAAAQGKQAGASRTAASALDQYIAELDKTNNASQRYLRAARQNTAVNANLIAQFQDIGVSLAGGQNPLLVLIQQGSQISYIASTIEGGYKGVARAVMGWFVVQKTANTEAVKATTANLAQARSAEAVVIAEARKAETAAAVLVAQRALTVSQAQVTAAEQAQTAAATELTAATAALEVAQLAAAGTAGRSAAAQNALTAALARQVAAKEAATVASAKLATARVAQASAATGVAAAESGAAAAVAGKTTALSGLAIALGIVSAVAIPAGLALMRINEEANANAGLNEYVKALGLTQREIRQLKDVSVTAGDTMSAAWQVVSTDMLEAFGLSTDQIKEFWNDTVSFIIDAGKYMAASVYGIIYSLVATIGKIVMNIGRIFYNAGVAAKNLFLMSIEALVNRTIQGINAINDTVNALSNAAGFGDVVSRLNEIDLGVGRVTDGMMELSAINPYEDFLAGGTQAVGYLEQLGDRIQAQAEQNARDRLDAQAADIIANRTGGSTRSPRSGVDRAAQEAERRAEALRRINSELDTELSRMRLLGTERDVQQRMDQITEQLMQKRITLTNEERAAIEGKVRAVEEFRVVQAQMDRIYEEINGPAQTYQATLAAINELQAQGAITAERAAQEQVLANRAYQEALDPLFQMKEVMAQQEATLGLYGQALEQANYYESIRQQFLSQGIVLSMQYVAGVNAEVDALMRRNAALQQGQYIQSQAASFIDPALEQNRFIENYQNIYAEIQRMRDEDLGNEAAYQQALYALQAKYNEMRLGGVSDFFGALAQVTSKGHGAIGAISKAAAVAQATIDGYVAVQKALASLPPPFNFAAAAAVAIKTGAQVAGILSTNVGSFATGGQFMVEGKSGVDANNINMNVTRGERVTVETPAQQRANDSGNDAGPPVVKLTNVNVLDPREALAALNTSEGDQVMLNFIERNSPAVKQLLGTV